MKKLMFCLMAFFLGCGDLWAAPLRVVTTTEDLAAIAREVGGDYVRVKSLTRGCQDPHFLEARPSLMLKASNADLFIQVGLGLESGWATGVLVGARNPAIQPGARGFLDASQKIDPVEIPSVSADRSQGDVHPYGNPHYWLDPENGKILSQTIAGKIIELLPRGREEIQRNHQNFKKRLGDAIGRWENRMIPYQGSKMVTYHNSWTYLEKRFGLEVVGYIEPKPGISPSPAHIDQLISLMKQEKVKVIVMEPYFNRSIPDLIGRETGAAVLVLPPSVGGADGVKTYIDLFDHITEKLAEVLSKEP